MGVGDKKPLLFAKLTGIGIRFDFVCDREGSLTDR